MGSINEKIEQAEKHLEAEEFSAADSLFAEAVAENPEKWQAWRGLGFVRLHGGQFKEAADAFGKARVIRADDVRSHYGYGKALQSQGDHAAAIRAFEEALYRDHGHEDSKKAIAISLLAQVDHMRSIGNLLAVEEYLEKAHKYEPSNHETTVQLFGYYEKTGQAHKLQTLATELRRHGFPVPDRSEYLTAETTDDSDSLPESVDELRQIVTSKPENWKAWRALGFQLLESGSSKEAEESFRKATLIRPDDVQSQMGLGKSFQAQGDHNHAIHAFEVGLSHDRGHVETKKALNESLLAYVDHMEQIGNLLAVEQYLEKAHRNDLGNEDVTRRLTRYYNQTGQMGKKQIMEQELQRHGFKLPEVGVEPEQKLAGSEHRSALQPETDFDALTRPQLEELLQTEHENWRALRALGFCLVEEGQAQEAAEAFKKATVIRFDDADSQYGLGLAYQLMDDHAHAIHPLEEALRQNPRHEKAKTALKASLLHYADHMEEIGNLLAVEQFVEKAHRCDPQDRAVAERLFNYYRSTGQGGKASKLAAEMGIAAPDDGKTETYRPASDDVLLHEPRKEPVLEPAMATVGPSLGSATPHAPAPSTGSSAPASVDQTPAMLPCPKCKQSMPSRSRICPHCNTMVDPLGGRILSGNAEKVNASAAETTYKVIAWLRIVVGALLVVGAPFIPIPITNYILAVVGGIYLLTGIGLLMEWEWLQTLVYWGSILGALGSVAQILMAITSGNVIAIGTGLLNLAVNGITAWAIKQFADV